jgi:DNA-binding CsgD family transcriptional regulator
VQKKEFLFLNPTFRKFYEIPDGEDLSSWSAHFISNIIPPKTNELYAKLIEKMRLTDAITSSIASARSPVEPSKTIWRFATMKYCKKNNHLLSLAVPLSGFYRLGDKIKTQTNISEFQENNFKRFLSLTKREKEVMSLTLNGLSNKEAGDRLYLSIETIKQHMKNIREKLNVKKLSDLIKFADAYYITSNT